MSWGFYLSRLHGTYDSKAHPLADRIASRLLHRTLVLNQKFLLDRFGCELRIDNMLAKMRGTLSKSGISRGRASKGEFIRRILKNNVKGRRMKRYKGKCSPYYKYTIFVDVDCTVLHSTIALVFKGLSYTSLCSICQGTDKKLMFLVQHRNVPGDHMSFPELLAGAP